MPITVRLADGRTVTVQTDDPQAAARAAHAYQQNNPAPQKQVSLPEDVALSAAQGAQNIPGIVVGTPGGIRDLWDQYITQPSERLADSFAQWAGRTFHTDGGETVMQHLQRTDPARAAAVNRISQHFEQQRAANPNARSFPLPNPEQLTDLTSQVTGFRHTPQTMAGEYAKTATEFLPALAGGEASAVQRLARVAVPAAATESAGQAARRIAPESESAVRLATGLATGVGMARAEGAAARAASVRNAADQRAYNEQAPIRQLEQDQGIDLTAGERAGNARAMSREESLRRGGPEQAQAQLHEFDNRRAGQVAAAQMRIATRGQQPVNPDLGSAGTNLANDLRDQWEAAQTQRAQRYNRAMELAGNEPIPPTDELMATVQNSSREHFGNLDNGAVNIIRDLNDEIVRGQATYARVERARQALNDELGDAMAKPGNGRQVMAIHRIIDDLDAFAEQRVSPKARQQIREARGFSREMMSMYGQQLRPQLSTGHTGRVDGGGRVIRDILNRDLSGEQIIDSIFGTNTRPLRSTLAAVQRIKDNATKQTVTSGYNAETAGEGQQVRGAGRQTLRGGRSTRGGRQFDPTPAQQARFGVELPRNDLQALREAFIYRLQRPLEARGENGAVPFQTLATNLRQSLHGPGAQITRIIFNKTELKQLENHLRLLERAAPPRGNYSPSSPGIAQDAIERSSAALFARLLSRIPGAGGVAEAINDHIVNARAIRDARNAVAPPKPPALRPVGSPSVFSPAYDAVASQQNQDPRPLGASYGIGEEPVRRRLGQQ